MNVFVGIFSFCIFVSDRPIRFRAKRNFLLYRPPHDILNIPYTYEAYTHIHWLPRSSHFSFAVVPNGVTKCRTTSSATAVETWSGQEMEVHRGPDHATQTLACHVADVSLSAAVMDSRPHLSPRGIIYDKEWPRCSWAAYKPTTTPMHIETVDVSWTYEF